MKALEKNALLSSSIIFAVSLQMLCMVCSRPAFSQQRRPLLIVAFGNSTTAPRPTVHKVYAQRLSEILSEAKIDTKVINAGIPGSHTGSVKDNRLFGIPHAMDRFADSVLRYRPDWVTINFGINDSWQDMGENDSSRIPLAKYRKNLLFFIQEIRKIKGQVILLTPNPLGKENEGFHSRRLEQYMEVTRELATENKVMLVDTWKIFTAASLQLPGGIDDLLLDGTHPNDLGHQLIATEISRIIMASP